MCQQHWAHHDDWQMKDFPQPVKTLYSERIAREQTYVQTPEPSLALICFRRDQEYLTSVMEGRVQEAVACLLLSTAESLSWG